MKVQKIRLKRMLLCLCSCLFLLIGLCGCEKKDYILEKDFHALVQEAYNYEDEKVYSSSPISTSSAIVILENLCGSTITTDIHDEFLTKDQADQLIEKSLQLFLEGDVTQSQVADLKEIEDISDYVSFIEENTYEYHSIDLQIGQNVLINDEPYVIEDIDDQSIVVKEAEITDLYDSIDIDEEIEIHESDIELEEGVEIAPSSIQTSMKALNLTLKLNFKSGKTTYSTDFKKLLGLNQSVVVGCDKETFHTLQFQNLSVYPDLQTMATDLVKKNGEEIKLETNKYSTGYTVTGEVKLSNIMVHPTLKLKEGKIEKLGIDFSYDFDSKIAYKGKIQDDLKLATINVPVGQTGLTVKAVLYLNVTANGEASLVLKHADHTKILYENGITRKVNAQSTSMDSDGALRLFAGPKFQLNLALLNKKIANVDLLVQGELAVEGSLEVKTSKEHKTRSDQVYLNYGLNGYIPIITLEMGNEKSLVKSLGISFKSNIVDKKAAHQISLFNKQILIYEKESEIDGDEMILGGTLNIDQYYIPLEVGDLYSFKIISLPDGYTKEDLIYEIDHPQIARIDHGTLEVLTPGNATVTISTRDRQFSITCTIAIPILETQEFVGL